MKNKLLLLTVLALVTGCNKRADTGSSDSPSSGSSSYLYVSSGGCYAGGVTPSATYSSTVAKFNMDGTFNKVIIDYNSFSPGDVPVAVTDYSSTHLLVTVENTAGRRIDLVPKDGSTGPTTYLVNSAGLGATGVLRSASMLSDGSILVAKTTAVELFSSGKARVTQGANPYINNPTGACATTNTMVTDVFAMDDDKILYTHSAASPNNKTVLIDVGGWTGSAGCLSAQAAPIATSLPTDVLQHSSGKILISYGSTTTASNLIYSYDLSGSTWSGATSAYSTTSVVNAPTTMVEDRSTGDVYVANGNPAFNTIEKFTFNPTTGTLTRVGTSPYIGVNAYTKCVSSMLITN